MVHFNADSPTRTGCRHWAGWLPVALIAWMVAMPAAAVEQKSASAGEVRALWFTTTATVLAGTQGGGLFTSSNSGANWARVAGFPAKYVWAIAQEASNGALYAATTEGLYKSTDGATGAAWTALTRDDTRAVAVSGSGGSALVLAGVHGVGVLRSTNGGTTFADFSSGLDSLDVRSIVINGADAYLAAYNILYVDPQTSIKTHANVGGVFKASNAASASTWANINTQGSGTLDSKFITAVVVDGTGGLYAASREPEGAGSGKVHRLMSGSWTNPGTEATGQLYDVETLAVDRTTTTHVWAGSRALGPYKWNGTQWSRQIVIATDPDLLTGIIAIGTNTSGAAVVGTRGVGAMASSNGASPWNLGAGLKADRVLAWTSHDAAAPGTYYVGLRSGGVMRSADSGGTWAAFNNGLSPSEGAPYITTVRAIAGNPSNANEIYAVFESFGLHKWNGSAWVLAADSGRPTPVNPQNLLYPDSTSLLYSDLYFNMGVFRRDATNTWTLRQSGQFTGSGIGKIRPTAIPGTYYATTYDYLPYVSVNSGTTWTQVLPADVTNYANQGFMRLAFLAIADHPNGGRMLAATNKGLFGKAIGGPWTRIAATGLPTSVLSGIAYSKPSAKAWATTRDGGLYCSNDAGTSWQSVSQPFPAVIVDLVARGNELFLLTDGAGLLRHDGTTCP